MLPSKQLDTELIESGCRRAGKTQESHSHPKLVSHHSPTPDVTLERRRMPSPASVSAPSCCSMAVRQQCAML